MWFCAGLKCAANDTDMVLRGWAKCGLRRCSTHSLPQTLSRLQSLHKDIRITLSIPCFWRAIGLQCLKRFWLESWSPIRSMCAMPRTKMTLTDTADLVMDILTFSAVPEQMVTRTSCRLLPHFQYGLSEAQVYAQRYWRWCIGQSLKEVI